MKHHPVTCAMILCLTLAPMSGCGSDALLTAEVAAAVEDGNDETVEKRGSLIKPFKGTWVSREDPPVAPEDAPGGCAAYFNTYQDGHASHLGSLSGAGATCAFNVRVVDDPPFNLSGGAAPFFVADFTSEMTWTAANGDRLYVSADDGIFVQSLTDNTSSTMGTLVTNGGTGRFAGATGEVQVSAVGTAVTFSGWIAYDASMHRAR